MCYSSMRYWSMRSSNSREDRQRCVRVASRRRFAYACVLMRSHKNVRKSLKIRINRIRCIRACAISRTPKIRISDPHHMRDVVHDFFIDIIDTRPQYRRRSTGSTRDIRRRTAIDWPTQSFRIATQSALAPRAHRSKDRPECTKHSAFSAPTAATLGNPPAAAARTHVRS